MILGRLLPRRQPAGRPVAIDDTGLRSVSRTHVGRVRTINEDRVLDRADRGLWAVADGMGGHCAGDVAAQRIVDALRSLADSATRIDADAIEATLDGVGRRIHDDAGGATQVSGSTIVALHIEQGVGTLFWAGDSRAYRVRSGRIAQLSRDHSVVQELIDAGALSRDLADRHPQAHVVTRALGAMPGVAIERVRVDVTPGDLFLLCSDGLARGDIDPALLGGHDESLAAVADALLANALAAGGTDNISLVLIALD